MKRSFRLCWTNLQRVKSLSDLKVSIPGFYANMKTDLWYRLSNQTDFGMKLIFCFKVRVPIFPNFDIHKQNSLLNPRILYICSACSGAFFFLQKSNISFLYLQEALWNSCFGLTYLNIFCMCVLL